MGCSQINGWSCLFVIVAGRHAGFEPRREEIKKMVLDVD